MTIEYKAKHSAPITILPNGIQLTSKEAAELCLLEDLYDTGALTEYELNDEFDFKRTSNIGLHYFCINNSCELRFLASNPTISAEVAYAIFGALYAPENRYPVIRNTCINLLCSKAVLNDIKLFELIFNKTFVGAYKKDILLKFYNQACYAPLDIVVFILPKLKEANDDFVMKQYLSILNRRENEILHYVNETNSLLAGLPMSWILKAYGFKS